MGDHWNCLVLHRIRGVQRAGAYRAPIPPLLDDLLTGRALNGPDFWKVNFNYIQSVFKTDF